MKIILFGSTGGIGSAIKDSLEGHELISAGRDAVPLDSFDWVIFAQGSIEEHDIFETFLANTMVCIAYTESLIQKGSKGFIYISSTASIKGNTRFPIYSASKAALNSYTETMARKYPELQFYALCPGPTDTKMWRSLNLEGTAQDPSEVAKAVQRIMAGEFTSGDIINVRNGEVTV